MTTTSKKRPRTCFDADDDFCPEQDAAEMEHLASMEDYSTFDAPPLPEEIEAANRNAAASSSSNTVGQSSSSQSTATADAPLPIASPRRVMTRSNSAATPPKRQSGPSPLQTDVPPAPKKKTELTATERSTFVTKARAYFESESRRGKKYSRCKSWDARRDKFRADWAKLSAKQRQPYAVKALAALTNDAEKKRLADHPLVLGIEEGDEEGQAGESGEGKEPTSDYRFQGVKVLMTYFRDDWVFPLASDRFFADLDEVCEAVREQGLWKEIVRSCGKEVGQMIRRVNAVNYTWSVELCPRTWDRSKIARAHLHVALDWTWKVKIAKDKFKVGETTPTHVRPEDAVFRKKSRSAGSHHHYLQIPKIGSLGMSTNFEQRKDFPVLPRWIVQHFQTGRITYETAESVFCLMFLFAHW